MEQFKIICDSACDLPIDMINENDIDLVSFYICFENNNYYRQVDESSRDFYKKMVDNPNLSPKTSMPTTDSYYECFEKYAKQDIPMICVCISSKISGSYNGALVAKKDILEKYPNARIEVIDSYLLTGVEGLVAIKVIEMRKLGYDLNKTVEEIEKLKMTGRAYFTIGNMDYLARGGRVGKLKSFIGSVLRIKPVIDFKNGEIDCAGIAMTRKKALQKVLDAFRNYFKKNQLKIEDYDFGFGYGYDEKEGLQYVEDMKKELNIKDAFVFQIGATVGVHTGPHPLGIAFIQKIK